MYYTYFIFIKIYIQCVPAGTKRIQNIIYNKLHIDICYLIIYKTIVKHLKSLSLSIQVV
jgi:hypothetical protein